MQVGRTEIRAWYRLIRVRIGFERLSLSLVSAASQMQIQRCDRPPARSFTRIYKYFPAEMDPNTTLLSSWAPKLLRRLETALLIVHI